MFELFRPRERLVRGVLLPGQSAFIQRTYRDRLDMLRLFYREKMFYLHNNHILTRLLNTELGSMRADYSQFVQTATDRVGILSRGFLFTSGVSYGKMWPGTFYGPGSQEIIIAGDTEFNVDYAVKNWQNITAVRVLSHDISDFGMVLPNGKKNHTSSGLAVIYINVPLLMLQYRRFIEDQILRAKAAHHEPIITPTLFLYKYVLPGMMLSHIDHVVVNRLMNLYYDQPNSVALSRSQFMQAEAGTGVEEIVTRAQTESIGKLTKSPMNYDQALVNIFTIEKNDALELLLMPDIAPTRQVWWAFLLARLKHMKFLLRLSHENGSNNQRNYSNRLIIDLTRLLDSHVLARQLPPELLESTIIEINETIALARS